MAVAFYLLLVTGHLGFFDVIYYHTYRCRLARRTECQKEVFWHTLRHFIYASQFLVIAHFRFHGAALLALLALYVADVFIAWADVWEETGSRGQIGGLPRGEYFMHVILSVLVGGYLASVAQAVWPDRLLPAGVVVAPPDVPRILRLYMTGMSLGAYGFFFHDLWIWLDFRRKALTA